MASSSSSPQQVAFSRASSSSSHKEGEDRAAFSGIEPPHERRRVSESLRLYDVFINHRGPDVKNTLALHLYKSLEKLNIRAFLDSEEKELGVSFTSTIETAIRSAAVHIAIFSKGYAESPWCLEELVLMLRSKAKIIPLFYDVEPSALRYIEKGVYGNAFIQYHEKSRYLEKLVEWKEALQSVSFIAGEKVNSDNKCEKIISAVQKEIEKKRPLYVAKYPVGLPKLVEQFQKQCIDKLVQDFESQCGMSKQVEGKCKIVGIFGMGGVGKTTLSKEFFNRKRLEYSRSCFLFDVREASMKRDLPSLQLKLLRELFDEKDHLGFPSVEDGISCLSNRFARKKNPSFLIVVDDIDRQEQLDALLISDELNTSGNCLVIVTTRDVGVLINAGITIGYNLKGMDRDDAKELYCWHAFRKSKPSSGYEELVDRFVYKCGGLPLSLQVLGSHVRGKDQKFWELELKKVEKSLPQEIHKKLRISIDTLDNEEKQIFMDVACFFTGESKEVAIRVWEASGYSAQHALGRLKEKCLVEEIEAYKYREELNDLEAYKYRKELNDLLESSRGKLNDLLESSREKNFVLRMHDHLRDLGREMADELKDPRRLWRSQHLEPLESKELKIYLTQSRVRGFIYFGDPLKITLVKCFLGESENMAETSTVLLWYELSNHRNTAKTLKNKNIPPWVLLQNLQSLWIAGGSLKRFGLNDKKAPSALKELQICRVADLELSLGFLRCLEIIKIDRCPYLRTVTGISDLRKLVELNISRCGELEELSLAQHNCLEKIRIFGCGNLQCVTVSRHEKLIELNISGCRKIEELSLVQLSRLQKIEVSDCSDLKSVSHCSDLKSVAGISDLRELVELQIANCPKLYLEKIRICDCSHLKSVAGMSDLRMLVEFQIGKSPKLEETSFFQLNCLGKIRISDCLHLKSVAGMSGLKKLIELQVEACLKLEEISFFQLDCLEKIRISDCPHLKSLAGMSDLRKLAEFQIEKCQKLEEISFFQLNCLGKIRISDCLHLKSVTGMSGLKKLVELEVEKCPNFEKISFFQLDCLEEIRISDCSHLKSIEVKDCKNLRGVNLEDLLHAVKLTICDCPELENLSELVSLGRLKMVLLNKCPKLKKITIPTTIIKLTLQCCRELQTAEGLYDSTDVEELFISKCPVLELDELSFDRLSCLKAIAIDSRGKIQKITGFGKLQSLERMQLFYFNNETVRNCILNMEKLPSDFIQVISKAEDRAESNLNASFFCEEHISAKSVIQISTDHDCPDDQVSAIILCAVVVVKTSTAADMINDFIEECDCNPWLKFEVRQGEWLIASVITNPDEIHRYILDKGYYFPFDYVFIDQAVTEDVMVRKGYKVTLPGKKGEEHKALNLLRRIVEKLF